jgi:Kef-type K+ transport system membrane component KefB
MRHLFLLLLVSVTSIGAYLFGRRRLGLERRQLRVAVLSMLEMIGLSLVFFTVNVGVGLVSILAARELTSAFFSVYTLNDVSLVALSALQGLIFGFWRARP